MDKTPGIAMSSIRDWLRGLKDRTRTNKTADPGRLKHLFLDEANYYLRNLDENLKEELRQIDGVPNATYAVQNGQVFVFNKLLKLVNEARALRPDAPLADLALDLLPDATVSAKEAVEIWHVDIEPFDWVVNPAGGKMIRHRAFNARLPGSFEHESEAHQAFATLLLGGVLPGSGDFTYRGQAMTLCEPLDTSLLPPRPCFDRLPRAESDLAAEETPVAYQHGFEPISEALFNDVIKREAEWRKDTRRAERYAHDRAADIWSRAASLGLERLNVAEATVPDYAELDCAELRLLYPELAMLSDGTLYELFDVYQNECCYISGWTAYRDDNFLFYVIGRLATSREERDNAETVGRWACFALLVGDSLDAAMAFARSASAYDRAISSLAERTKGAMRFLASDKFWIERRGRAITTLGDRFRMGRKYRSASTQVTQSFEDFSSRSPHQ